MTQKPTEEKYEELIKALQEGEFGMTKFLWDLLERIEGAADIPGTKILNFQKTIDEFIKDYKIKDGKPGADGKTPTTDQLLALIKPLITPGPAGKTPTSAELLELIESVMPDPIPGAPGKPGKPGLRGPAGRMPKHEWNGTLIRFENPDGSMGDWKNLQGPPGVHAEGPGFNGGGGLERVRAAGFLREGVTEIYFGDNITVTRTGNGVRIDAEAGGSGITIETPTGTVDDTNTTFTVTQEPKYIVVNGAQYFDGAGYTYTTGQIDLNAPVGENGFIRSVY